MIGIYFSGTGNTEHCVGTFVKFIDNESILVSLESKDIRKYIRNEKDTIVFGYPTQFSNAPIFVREFIKENKDVLKGKSIFIISTMGLFSGDGTGCTARLFKKAGAKVIGGLQVRMPDNICDVSALKKSKEENNKIIKKANIKIKKSAKSYVDGNVTKDGLSIFSHIAGLFGQRLWFYSKTKNYSKKIKINRDKCIKCGKCTTVCPTNNLIIIDSSVKSKNKCTMCYRCISKCPEKAITLLGKEVLQQYSFDKC